MSKARIPTGVQRLLKIAFPQQLVVIHVVIMLSIILSCGEKERWETYHSDLYGYSLDVPPGWQTIDTLDAQSPYLDRNFGVTLYSPAEDWTDVYTEHVSIEILTFGPEVSASDWIRSFVEDFQQEYPQSRVLDKGDASIDNRLFRWLDVRGGIDLANRDYLVYLVANGKRVFVLTCYSRPDAFESYRQVFKQTVHSFRFDGD